MGDIQNHGEKLKSLLKKLKYPKVMSIEDFNDNNPACFL